MFGIVQLAFGHLLEHLQMRGFFLLVASANAMRVFELFVDQFQVTVRIGL